MRKTQSKVVLYTTVNAGINDENSEELCHTNDENFAAF
jgi:hypothetical protein